MAEDNEEINEIRKMIQAANRAYASLTSIFKTRNIHHQSKITLYKVMIRQVITYGSETWTLNKQAANILSTFERRILRRIYGPIQVNGIWKMRHNEEMCIRDSPCP